MGATAPGTTRCRRSVCRTRGAMLVWLTDDVTSAVPHVVVVGNFDGVHLGHQALFHGALDEARAFGVEAAVLTFDPHPAAIVGPGAPPMLTTLERKLDLIHPAGTPHAFVLRFHPDVAPW